MKDPPVFFLHKVFSQVTYEISEAVAQLLLKHAAKKFKMKENAPFVSSQPRLKTFDNSFVFSVI